MQLFIVRHAWAEEHDATRWPDDTGRPLTSDGKLRFSAVAERLVKRDFAPGLIATSPLVRCRETTEILVAAMPHPPEVVVLDALAPCAELTDLLDWAAQQMVASLAWVGHAPDVGHLTAALVGDGAANIRFAKGAVAAIDFDAEILRSQGTLRWLATAKLLGC